jgi:hypothetical protein
MRDLCHICEVLIITFVARHVVYNYPANVMLTGVSRLVEHGHTMQPFADDGEGGWVKQATEGNFRE